MCLKIDPFVSKISIPLQWLTRNELNYSVNCWYESFLYHDVPEAEKELMFILSQDSTMDEIEGVYLISENPITIKSN